MSLSAKQIKAVVLFNSGLNAKEVAQQLSVTPATLCNWKREPEFIVLSNQMLKHLLDEAGSKLVGLVSKAVESLEGLLGSDDGKVALKACELVLSSNGLKGDNEYSFMRYGQQIGPTSLREYENDRQRIRISEVMGG